MADYNVQVSWSGKDALSDSDAGKVISGDDFHTEFTAVKTAMDTKADIASETLTGTPLAPTAAVGTDSTQIATTAFVKNVLETYIYPVGSIYFNMAVSTNPGTLLGFGTWAAYAEGRVLVGFQSSGTFDSLDESLGAETAAHTLTVDEMPAHTHDYGKSTTSEAMSIHDIVGLRGAATTATSSTGGGSAHSHSTK